MRNVLIIAAAIVVLGPNVSYAAEPSKNKANNPDITGFSMAVMNAQSADVASLRETPCGGNPSIDQDANNAAFAACVMYVLGAVDMIREWLDPTHAPRVCAPRTVSTDGLILVIQGGLAEGVTRHLGDIGSGGLRFANPPYVPYVVAARLAALRSRIFTMLPKEIEAVVIAVWRSDDDVRVEFRGLRIRQEHAGMVVELDKYHRALNPVVERTSHRCRRSSKNMLCRGATRSG
jgi:hypothetical protein